MIIISTVSHRPALVRDDNYYTDRRFCSVAVTDTVPKKFVIRFTGVILYFEYYINTEKL